MITVPVIEKLKKYFDCQFIGKEWVITNKDRTVTFRGKAINDQLIGTFDNSERPKNTTITAERYRSLINSFARFEKKYKANKQEQEEKLAEVRKISSAVAKLTPYDVIVVNNKAYIDVPMAKFEVIANSKGEFAIKENDSGYLIQLRDLGEYIRAKAKIHVMRMKPIEFLG